MSKPTGIAAIAAKAGKGARSEQLGSVTGRLGAGLSTIGGGNPAMHSLGHYGKNAPAGLLGFQPEGSAGVDPMDHPGMVRGGKVRSHVREGSLGPGKMGVPGRSNTDYSATNNPDLE